MSKFEEIIGHLLEVEGGSKYTNHPADKGGPTKWGVTQGALSAWRGHGVSANDVKNLTKAEAIQIYKARYWDVNRTTEVNSKLVARILFDQSVNRGYRTAARLMQRACNLFPGAKLSVDGKVGVRTLERVEAIHDIELANKFIQLAQDAYADIVVGNRSQIVFLRGWINRTQHLMDFLTGAKTTWPRVSEGGNVKTPDATNPTEDTLFKKIVAFNPGINKTGLAKALNFYDHPKITNKSYITLVDFDINSRNERMWVIDTQTGKGDTFKVAHGRYSDPDHDGNLDKAGNVPGSGMSSVGAMVVTKPYGKDVGGWSKFRTAIKLDGLEPGLNNNVNKRAVVFHDSKYVHEDDKSLPGRSLGCFAVDDKVAQAIQARIKGGSLLYAYDKDFIK